MLQSILQYPNYTSQAERIVYQLLPGAEEADHFSNSLFIRVCNVSRNAFSSVYLLYIFV